MSDLTLLRPLLIQGLLGKSLGKRAYDFKAWSTAGKYFVRNIPNRKRIEIDVNNEHDFFEMLAFDGSRMASASFESMLLLGRSEGLPKSTAWIAIQAYYAAFFSAHATMRFFGFVCSHLERGHVTIFNQHFAAQGSGAALNGEAGLFAGRFDQTSRLLALEKVNNPHEGTWKCFTECLRSISREVLTLPGTSSAKATVSSEIDDLVSLLTASGNMPNGNFLSRFRNDVNYRQMHCFWFPYGKHSIRSRDAVHILNHWKRKETPVVGSSSMQQEVHSFFYGCLRTVHLAKKLVELILAYSEDNKSVFKLWPSKLVRIVESSSDERILETS